MHCTFRHLTRVHVPCRYNLTFTEDGSAVSVFADNFQITSEENSLVARATITVTYSRDLLPGVQDVLSSTTFLDRFNATFDASVPSLVIDAVGPFRLLTTQDQMRDFLKGVTFSTNDQAPDVSRNLTVGLIRRVLVRRFANLCRLGWLDRLLNHAAQPHAGVD